MRNWCENDASITGRLGYSTAGPWIHSRRALNSRSNLDLSWMYLRSEMRLAGEQGLWPSLPRSGQLNAYGDLPMRRRCEFYTKIMRKTLDSLAWVPKGVLLMIIQCVTSALPVRYQCVTQCVTPFFLRKIGSGDKEAKSSLVGEIHPSNKHLVLKNS